MRADGLRGVRRGRPFVTTRPDPGAAAAAGSGQAGLHRRRRRTSCGWSTSPTCRPGRAWRSPRSSPTCSPAASSAGAPRPRCRPSCRSTRWRWRCGPAAAPASPSPGWCTTPTPGPNTPRSATPTGSPTPARVASIGSVGDSYDNALAESVIGLYKTECVRHEGPWRGVDDLELATLSWVDWFNETGSTAARLRPTHRVREPATTVRSTPSSNRCRENPASTKPGALQVPGCGCGGPVAGEWLPGWRFRGADAVPVRSGAAGCAVRRRCAWRALRLSGGALWRRLSPGRRRHPAGGWCCLGRAPALRHQGSGSGRSIRNMRKGRAVRSCPGVST